MPHRPCRIRHQSTHDTSCFALSTRINMITRLLCRTRYQIKNDNSALRLRYQVSQRLTSEAVMLRTENQYNQHEACFERGFRPTCEVKTGAFNPQTIFRRPEISHSSLICEGNGKNRNKKKQSRLQPA